MVKLAKLLLLLVIFLAGCTNSHTDDFENSTFDISYTIQRADNGVYLYVDKPHNTDLKVYFPREI